MKIFSLQTTGNVVGWSVVMGLVLNQLMNIFVVRQEICGGSGMGVSCEFLADYGFPFSSLGHTGASNFVFFSDLQQILNTVIWFLAALLILGLVSYLKYRKVSPNS
jgi:hypothetical protein